MKREKTSASQEDYLKQIWETVQEEQTPISARLAEDLGVTPPAVNAALKRMTRGGFLRLERGGRIALTPKGRKIAQYLVLRHRLAEKLLTDVIGADWRHAHEEAERLEHGISPEVVRLLLKRFGHESRCPHGVPLFGGMSKLRRRYGAVPLAEAPVGHAYEVMRVYEREPEFLAFLSRLGILPGVRVRVFGRAYDETMTVTLGSHSKNLHIGKPATSRIWVRKTAASGPSPSLRASK